MPFRYQLRLPTEDDIAEMLEVQDSAFFENPLNLRCFPPPRKIDEATRKKYLSWVPESILVTSANDHDEGKILGWARWVRRPLPTLPEPRVTYEPEMYPSDGDPELAAQFFQTNTDKRSSITMNRDYWFLSTLVVRPEAQRKGIGRLLMCVGTDAADKEDWISYLNATVEGKSLYENMGFRVVDTSRFTEDIITYHMLREPQPRKPLDQLLP